MNFKQVVEEEKEKIAEAAREYARQSYLVSEESHPVADEMKAWDELLGIYDQAMTKAAMAVLDEVLKLTYFGTLKETGNEWAVRVENIESLKQQLSQKV